MIPLVLPDSHTDGSRAAWATTSDCGRYRYALGRAWDDEDSGRPIFSVIMLNPSTADAFNNDPTIRKCIHFAKQEGCGSLLVRNLFAYRATNPGDLKYVADPVGEYNLALLERDVTFGLRVAAWGQLGPSWLRKRAQLPISHAKIRGASHVLALTEHGYDRSSLYLSRATRQPRHPLYLANATRVQLWSDASKIQDRPDTAKDGDDRG